MFWLVACAVAESTAISPVLPTTCSLIFTSFSPMSALFEGFSCIRRPSFFTPESNEMTLMPRAMAFLSEGTSASGSLAEITMAFTFCAISELTISIWPSAVALAGPV